MILAKKSNRQTGYKSYHMQLQLLVNRTFCFSLYYKVAIIIAYDTIVNPQAIQNGKLVVTVPEDFGPLM